MVYFRKILPILGGLISGDRAAYQYLNESVEAFPYGDDFVALMKNSGFRDVTIKSLTFGIASIYIGYK